MFERKQKEERISPQVVLSELEQAGHYDAVSFLESEEGKKYARVMDGNEWVNVVNIAQDYIDDINDDGTIEADKLESLRTKVSEHLSPETSGISTVKFAAITGYLAYVQE